MSIAGILIGVLCIGVMVTLIMQSYYYAGNVETGFGGVGLFSAILNIIGILCGTSSLSERDIYISAAIVAICINAVTLLAWILMIIIPMF